MNILDREPLAGLAGLADGREDALDGRIFFKILGADFGQGDDGSRFLRGHAQERLGQQPFDCHAQLGRFECGGLLELLFLHRPPAPGIAEREEDFDLEGMQAADEGGNVHC